MAQLSADSGLIRDTLLPSKTLFALPLAFFTPETDWGFGAAGILAFRFKNNPIDSRPSQMQLGFAYTLNKQFLAYLPYQLFLRNGRYTLYGELGWYRYSYDFYGIGNTANAADREVYKVDFPRIRINALQQIKPKWYIGFRYWMDDFDVYDLQVDGLLNTTAIAGNRGSLVSGLGGVLNYDSRNNIFYPDSGTLAEIVLFHNSPAFGSDFRFSKLYIDISRYMRNKWLHTFVVNAYAEFTAGSPPFNQMALLGGTRRMRGYYEGRFRDKQMLMIQGEYRFPIFWLFKGAVFGGVGRVAEELSDFNWSDWKYNVGAGLRIMINKKEKIHIRLDAAVGQSGNSGYYVTIGEAF